MSKRVVRNRLAEEVAKKERRENRLITNTIAAAETGLNINTIGDWMANRVTAYKAETIRILCEWLPCEPQDLFVFEEVDEEDSMGDKKGATPYFEVAQLSL